MILPASKEEGRLIKKRYAVFNLDGSLAELKGFELKRRGELKLIKCFQGEVFSRFLEGDSLASCYAAVADVANRWLDLLDTRGAGVDDDELMRYISESCTMSKALHEYEGRKSCAITTAHRLASFLGDERIKDKGLNCNYVVSARPRGAPTSERAVPVAVFATEPPVARAFLRKWCGDLDDGRDPSERPDVRAVVDWDYYRERLASTIQKIVTIPAAMQRVTNPVPRVRHPDWLHRRVREKEDRFQQKKLDGFFVPVAKGGGGDIEVSSDGEKIDRRVFCFSVRFANHPTPLHTGLWPPHVLPHAHPSPRRRRHAARHAHPAACRAPPPPPRSLSPPPPDRRSDPAGWVAAHKRKWRAAVADRKKRRAAAVAAAAAGGDDRAAALAPPPPRGGVGALLARAEAAAVATHWQILALDYTPTPGVLTLWALAGGALHRVPLRVPSTVYVASTLPPTASALTALGAVPARRDPPFAPLDEGVAMYAVTLPPGASLAARDALDGALAAPHVRGVWERSVSPRAHAALTLGCVASLAPAARGKSLADGVDLGDLVMRTTAECDFLEGGGSESAAAAAAPRSEACATSLSTPAPMAAAGGAPCWPPTCPPRGRRSWWWWPQGARRGRATRARRWLSARGGKLLPLTPPPPLPPTHPPPSTSCTPPTPPTARVNCSARWPGGATRTGGRLLLSSTLAAAPPTSPAPCPPSAPCPASTSPYR